MKANDYQNMAMESEADQEQLCEWRYQQGENATRIQNGLNGLVDEVGELASAVKKWLEYQVPGGLDTNNMKEEVGDCLWRLSQIAKGCGFTLEEAMVANLQKLKIRYKDGFTKEEAAEENRNRQAEAEVMEKPLPKINDKLHERQIREANEAVNGTRTPEPKDDLTFGVYYAYAEDDGVIYDKGDDNE